MPLTPRQPYVEPHDPEDFIDYESEEEGEHAPPHPRHEHQYRSTYGTGGHEYADGAYTGGDGGVGGGTGRDFYTTTSAYNDQRDRRRYRAQRVDVGRGPPPYTYGRLFEYAPNLRALERSSERLDSSGVMRSARRIIRASPYSRPPPKTLVQNPRPKLEADELPLRLVLEDGGCYDRLQYPPEGMLCPDPTSVYCTSNNDNINLKFALHLPQSSFLEPFSLSKIVVRGADPQRYTSPPVGGLVFVGMEDIGFENIRVWNRPGVKGDHGADSAQTEEGSDWEWQREFRAVGGEMYFSPTPGGESASASPGSPSQGGYSPKLSTQGDDQFTPVASFILRPSEPTSSTTPRGSSSAPYSSPGTNAYYPIPTGGAEAVITFNPPISARYVVLKIFGDDEDLEGNVDLEYVGFWGTRGRKSEGKVEFR
ncbi:hypothetical protein YB2330_002197 [Saitoella coloradoensis]